MELTELTISQAAAFLRKKEFSALELTKAFLEKIEEKDKEISAFLTVSRDLALFQAREVDDLILAKRELPVLAGIPSAIKDNILVEGIRCTAGSKILENYIAPYDASCIRKLKNQKVVILGKTNLDEFAMGSSTENSAFFKTKNPHDLKRVPGGSSGGSAAAVAANFCLFSLGSDTGGSIRQPASFCGVVGLKPTYGAVSRQGLIAFASSLDQIGPIAKNVEDAQIVFEAIKGRDEADSTSWEIPERENEKLKRIEDLKIGIPREYLIEGMDEEVERLFRETIKKIENQKAKIEEISLPHSQYALSCYYIIAPAEASANLARYDGIRYGLLKKEEKLLAGYLRTRQEGFGQEVKRRIMLGTYTLSAGYYQAYYLRAQKMRTLIKEDFAKAFEKFDLILTPVSPTPAFLLGEKISHPLKMYLSDIFTIGVNLAGLPALSLPIGQIENLPVGLQIIGPAFEERKLFAFAKILENL